MRFVRTFVVSAALFVGSTAVAGDSWLRVEEKEPTVYDEVSDGVFMPRGLLDSLPDADELLNLIDEDAQAAAKAKGIEDAQPAEKGIEVRQTVDGESWEQGGLTVHCWTVTTTVKFGTVEVTKRESSCTTT